MPEHISDERLAELTDSTADSLIMAATRGWRKYWGDTLACLRELQALRREREWRPTHKHRKGGLYRMRCVAQHSETLEPLAVYDDRRGNTWARPLAMFNEPERFAMLLDTPDA